MRLTSRDTLVRLWGAVTIHPGLGAHDKDQKVRKLRPVRGQSDKNK
jgi:hypothetical protein